MMGTVAGPGPAAGGGKTPAAASISGNPNPAILTILFILRRPWQSAATSKTARPGESWPAEVPTFGHSLAKNILDPPESAATPGSAGPASSALLLPLQPRRVWPARWSRPASPL